MIVFIICEDNGVGVLTGYKEKIFEQDFGKNTGLGLFLSQGDPVISPASP